MSRLDLLPRDMLFKLALELSYPDLITFCSNSRVNELVCEQKDIWLAKSKEDFGDYQILKSDPRENYELLRDLTILKEKLQLSEVPFYEKEKDIYQLYNTKSLSVEFKNIREIPKEIGRLVNLERLGLGNNKIETIPKEIGRLVNLEILDLGNNEIKAIPKEIGNLKNLKILNLNSNNIHKIPEEIGNLTNLQNLYLIDNKLYSLPDELGNLKNLKTLLLGENNFSIIPEVIYKLRLKTLDISANPVRVPEELARLKIF